MPTLTTSPWDAAISRLSDKTLVGSRLRSAEWADVPLALRDQALFSAGVENVRTLGAMRDKVLDGLTQARPGGTGMDRSRFVAEMRNLLGAAPGDSGDLTDLTSRRRLELVWDFQTADAHGHASFKADMDPDVLDAYPAQRLVRIEARRVPRDWYTLWATAGASVGWEDASRRELVALKTSPIWTALSRFGRPWPPFDYNSGMGLEDVERDEAERLDLLPKGEDPAARLQRLRDTSATAAKDWNAGLQASVKGLSPEARGWLSQAFGDQVAIEDNVAKWTGRTAPAVTPAVTPIAPPVPVAPVAPAPVAPAPATVLPDPARVVEAVARAQTRDEAHVVVALPAAERGSLTLNATRTATPQAAQAGEFIRTVLHKDVAPATSAKVEIRAGRAYYDPSTQTAVVRAGDVKTTIHELAHHIECSDPEILAECRAFLRSRAKPGEKPRSLAVLTGNGFYRPSEIAIEDDWVAKGGSVYMGKVYPDAAGATEILTMGLERLYEDPVGFARQDPDYFQFILKTLRPGSAL
jgi:hypothetical protein